MKKVERYECFYLSDQGYKHDALSKKHPEGWWVDYDDHEQAIREAFAAGAEAEWLRAFREREGHDPSPYDWSKQILPPFPEQP